MDYVNIPYFAKFRQAGTVIVRIKMEVSNEFCQPEECPVFGCPRSVDRPSICEQCSRTRLNKYSVCDSDRVVSTSRPYRPSSARSRYVNICAAVCLLLLVGGFLPKSSAAPHKRTMERQRRGTEYQENKLWADPCDYGPNPNASSYSPALAQEAAKQAHNTFKSSVEYKHKFAIQQSYDNFTSLLQEWSSDEWLRNFSWFTTEGLPKEKVLFKGVSDEYLNNLMGHIDSVLPSMYKGLKMVLAALHSILEKGFNNQTTDSNLEPNIKKTMHDVRSVLCIFNDIMRSRNLEIWPLLDSEVRDTNKPMALEYPFLVYRDTLNYLEYLVQVFQKMHDVGLKSAA